MKKLIYIFVVAAIAVACNTATTPGGGTDAEANKAKVQSFYDQVINAHNVDAIDSFCSADFVDHNPDPGHSGKGIDDLRAGFKDFFSGFPDVHVATNFMVASGDTVVSHVTMTGTNSGAMMGMPATNKKATVDGIDIIVIKDGKAVERWGEFDNAKMMQDLGMMPQPGAPKDTTAK
ncbi:MAG TPA: ester cyclase [Parafilimonas sp.]|nr:ester cyclase [Parafilimonas sp.]